MTHGQRAILLTIFAMVLGVNPIAAQITLSLPTDNDALFRGKPEEFYMYTDRDFEGVKSTPWEGGQFGYVRNPHRLSTGIVFQRMHAGIDIRPVHRDRSGEPLDIVRSIAPGQVVYVSDVPSHSNYGRYLIVEHIWDGCAYYSLYAHLNAASVEAGQKVDAGTPLGRLGYTGAGINKTRAHLHLEINMMLNPKFGEYYSSDAPASPNLHGAYNGQNLVPLDVTRILQESRKGTLVSIPSFVASEEPFYSVLLPNKGTPEMVRRYPWLLRGASLEGTPSMEIIFNRWGLPIQVKPGTRAVEAPTIASVRRSNIPYAYLTGGRITGVGEEAVITPRGLRYLQLITYPN